MADQEPEIEIISSQAEKLDEDGQLIPQEGSKGAQGSAASADVLAELEGWKQKHDEVKEKMLWVAADLDNYKKRALKEKEEFLKFSQAGLIKEVLVVADNLERALAALPADDTDKGLLTLKQGVDLTLKQFKSVLEKHGVTRIKVVGEPFDPKFHEVMFQETTDQAPDGTVLEELQAGYLLHDRVLRPALVKIAKNTDPKGSS